MMKLSSTEHLLESFLTRSDAVLNKPDWVIIVQDEVSTSVCHVITHMFKGVTRYVMNFSEFLDNP